MPKKTEGPSIKDLDRLSEMFEEAHSKKVQHQESVKKAIKHFQNQSRLGHAFNLFVRLNPGLPVTPEVDPPSSQDGPPGP